MEKYFPAEKIIKTGNPVRQNFDNLRDLKKEAFSFFNLTDSIPVILVLGGSLGAGSINSSLSENLQLVMDSGFQWIWQTGKHYYEDVNALVSLTFAKNIAVHGFINRMDYAFAVADVIITRAGAGTISELCLVGKPVILVPSPNVAEDHQTKNALALSERNAAILVPDDQASKRIVKEAITLISDNEKRKTLSENIVKMADRDADKKIAEEIMKLMRR
jgi:UDP-N-acetylglucosamine--N-acetylmuramyl-(pentapeptide) pyrophosphoryl-undecaprenol N-acetylglucosamine transferase